MRYIFDIEATGLLDDSTIDYTSSPYVLRPNFNIHCIVVQDIDSDRLLCFYDGETYIFDGREHSEVVEGITYSLSDYKPVTYEHRQLKEFKQFVLDNPDSEVIGHNILGYDLLALKLTNDMDYTVKHELEGTDTWCGLDMTFSDTMIMSKVFNPDRVGSHSLDNLAKLTKKDEKFEFRKGMKKDDKFRHFAGDMVYYCLRDGIANKHVYNYLRWEESLDNWDWKPALCLEHKIAEIVTRSSHRGFAFDKDLAEKCIKELDELMEERRAKVEPLLPPRKATKKFLGDHTPPKSQILEKDVNIPASFLSKTDLEITKTGLTWLERNDAQYDADTYTITVKGSKIKRDSSEGFPKVGYVEKTISANMKRFVTKHGGSWDEDNLTVTIFDKEMKLPVDAVPLKDTMIATIKDLDHIKQWLITLGWTPMEYKSKDITLKSGTKVKRDLEDLNKTVDRYIMETLDSEYCKDRCSHLKARPTYHSLRSKIMKKAEKYGVKVLTSPSFTTGQEKLICKALERISGDFPYVKDIVEYLTLTHRRSAILGGGFDIDHQEEAEKGYLANLREDGRIPTPADTQGTPTARFTHKIVVNVPSVNSLYGDKMRKLFITDGKSLMVGSDYDSLENKIQSHYVWKYEKEEGKPYCNSLILDKPFDSHTRNSESISKSIGKPFSRAMAKTAGYGLLYGSQVPTLSKTVGCDLETGQLIYDAYWKAAEPLKKLKDAVTKYWKDQGRGKFIKGIDSRKIYVRSEHSLLNSLLQSGGSICAKKTLVFLDKLLQDKGQLIDFFKDDYENSKFFALNIFMHDEYQFEENKSNFIFKSFKNEENMLTFINKDDRLWSEPIKKNGKLYIGYSSNCELISKAINMTNEEYKLNVPLTANYALGLSWFHTH